MYSVLKTSVTNNWKIQINLLYLPKIKLNVMSKTSAKSKYEQLMAWLPTLNQPKTTKEKSATKFSKADYYKEKGAKK